MGEDPVRNHSADKDAMRKNVRGWGGMTKAERSAEMRRRRASSLAKRQAQLNVPLGQSDGLAEFILRRKELGVEYDRTVNELEQGLARLRKLQAALA